MRLHEGEAEIGLPLVRRLLAEQAPTLAGLPLRQLDLGGTVNEVFRLGDELIVRLPRLDDGVAALAKELAWLPRLAPRLPMAIPVPEFAGAPDAGYAHPWAIYRWLDGEPYTPAADDLEAAAALAGFVRALRSVNPAGAPPAGRRPLRELDAQTREAIAACHEFDREAVTRIWDRLVDGAPWTGERTWMHSDLLPGNLLARDGRIGAVIDWGSAGAGDPAHDVTPAWTVLRGRTRGAYRAALGVDDDEWERARGIALHQAVLAIPYYRVSNPVFAAVCRATLGEILADEAAQAPPRSASSFS
jgi:aminoglycoside phosphotransferase (APT) family kinase protein